MALPLSLHTVAAPRKCGKQNCYSSLSLKLNWYTASRCKGTWAAQCLRKGGRENCSWINVALTWPVVGDAWYRLCQPCWCGRIKGPILLIKLLITSHRCCDFGQSVSGKLRRMDRLKDWYLWIHDYLESVTLYICLKIINRSMRFGVANMTLFARTRCDPKTEAPKESWYCCDASQSQG